MLKLAPVVMHIRNIFCITLAMALSHTSWAADATMQATPQEDAHQIELGRRIYIDGILASGQSLTAVRFGNATISGKEAACVSCHKRSGLGSVEGDSQIPPIFGKALYATGGKLKDKVIVSMDPRRGRSWNQSHPPYDNASLLAAVRDGVHVTGREMNLLMPRYALEMADIVALDAYLRQISKEWSLGVTADSVRLATVITPEVSAERRQAFIKTMQAAVDQKNASTNPTTSTHRHMINAAESILRVERRWTVDIWELEGAPDTWRTQMETHYRNAPVFALVSGMGDGNWDPVQNFCESNKVPCWFPSIKITPEQVPNQFYGLYYSNGVALEAKVLAKYFEDKYAGSHRVVQIIANQPAALAGADHLRQHMPTDWHAEDRVIGHGATLASALSGLTDRDIVVLWLPADDLKRLSSLNVPAAPVFASTLIGGGENAPISGKWHSQLRMVYPYALPSQRELDLSTFHSWLKIRNLELIDEPMQSEVYCTMTYLQFIMSEMLDNMYRDYMIERGETNLRRHQLLRAEEESMIRGAGHPPVPSVAETSRLAPGAVYGTDPHGKLAQINTPLVGQRKGTSIYPILDLSSGQRLASKGAYIVKFSNDKNNDLIAESDWIIPY